MTIVFNNKVSTYLMVDRVNCINCYIVSLKKELNLLNYFLISNINFFLLLARNDYSLEMRTQKLQPFDQSYPCSQIVQYLILLCRNLIFLIIYLTILYYGSLYEIPHYSLKSNYQQWSIHHWHSSSKVLSLCSLVMLRCWRKHLNTFLFLLLLNWLWRFKNLLLLICLNQL